MIPTAEQLEAWASDLESGGSIAGIYEVAAFLRSTELREALTAREDFLVADAGKADLAAMLRASNLRAEAWKALVMRAVASRGLDEMVAWKRDYTALLAQEEAK